jgi:hypothetical protein
MSRSQVISGLISKYDLIVNGQDKSAIELAVFKIAICQLVDAVFSGGGGGGGGSTSSATVSDGIDGSTDITTILSRLTDLVAKPNPPTQADIVSAIQSAADIDTIIARLTSLDTGKLTQASVEAAIQSAADIDTIIARLSSIVSNTGNISVVGSSVNTVNSYSRATIAITDVGGTIIASNANRKHAIIVNRSVNVCDLFFNTIGLFGDGLPLEPKQSYEVNNSNLFVGAISGRTDTGLGSNLAVLEGI